MHMQAAKYLFASAPPNYLEHVADWVAQQTLPDTPVSTGYEQYLLMVRVPDCAASCQTFTV